MQTSEGRGRTAWTRRHFLGSTGAASAAVLAGTARRASGGTGGETGSLAAGGWEATGDLASRIRLTAERMAGGGMPAFTDEFVLADVRLDPPRRFSNYSGDLSGRYVEAFSALPFPGRGPADLASLVARLRAAQKPDGRFGRADLRYTAAEIGVDHMPLLWGNGRLLVGLMAYHAATGDGETLASARRLGDFLLGVQADAGSPQVIERVEKAGAAGFICFTQLNEGLVLLGQATGDERCFAAARQIATLQRPRGAQHSHGYLTTLRGALMLHEATGEAGLLSDARAAVDDLLASPDLLVDGGIHEFFGWDDPTHFEALASARAGSGDDGRNEGCGLSDLVRLTLQLHRLTGDVTYLAAAERCWLNAFAHNQYATGDFGSRTYFDHGFKPVSSVGRAWWCCTMHGYRCYPDVLEAAVRMDGEGVRVDLFEDVRVAGTVSTTATGFGVQVRFESDHEGPLAVRSPGWAEAARLVRNGAAAEAAAEAGYLRLRGPFRAGDVVELVSRPRVVVREREGRILSLASLRSEPLRGALFAGPYLMAVSEEAEPDFFSEPWSGGEGDQPLGNIVRLGGSGSLRLGEARWPALETSYEHAGFPGTHEVSLRALGTRPARDQQIHAFWLNVARA